MQMMTQHHSFSFTSLKDLQAKILEIPYKNNDLSMFVLLPDDIEGLEKVKPRISPFLLSFWRLCVPELVLGEPGNRTSDLELVSSSATWKRFLTLGRISKEEH